MHDWDLLQFRLWKPHSAELIGIFDFGLYSLKFVALTKNDVLSGSSMVTNANYLQQSQK